MLPCSIGAAALALALTIGSGAVRLHAQDDLLTRSKAMYAGLRSYSDTGTVVSEYGPSAASLVREVHTFSTFYRAPRQFMFDFNKDKDAGGDRLVIWGDDAAFHTWWKTTGAEETYPPGQGAGAFLLAGEVTVGSGLQISPLLFSQAGLQGTLTNLRDMKVVGAEEIDGHRCQHLAGESRDLYATTGNEVNVRRTDVWIDVETLFVRKVLEGAPRGSVAGSIQRITSTFDPHANPTIADSHFRFTAPKGQE